MPRAPSRIRTISFQTRLGTKIKISQFEYPFSLWDGHQLEKLRRDYGFTFRNYATYLYNCHGLTFAGRRAWLGEDNLQKILKEDNYKPVDRNKVLPGDIILYFNAMGSIEHSGVVVGMSDAPSIPLVCSKLGHGEEVIHSAFRCPYSLEDIRFYRIIDENR